MQRWRREQNWLSDRFYSTFLGARQCQSESTTTNHVHRGGKSQRQFPLKLLLCESLWARSGTAWSALSSRTVFRVALLLWNFKVATSVAAAERKPARSDYIAVITPFERLFCDTVSCFCLCNSILFVHLFYWFVCCPLKQLALSGHIVLALCTKQRTTARWPN